MTPAVPAEAYTAGVPVDPVGIAEIAKRLGRPRQTVKGWSARKELPEPKWVVSGHPAWDWPVIERWATKHDRWGKVKP